MKPPVPSRRHRAFEPLLALVAIAAFGACAAEPDATAADGPDQATVQRYETRGVVSRLPSESAPALYVRHETIPDFVGFDGEVAAMDSMTMPFPLAEGIDLAGIEPGDKVAFTLEVEWEGDDPYRISRIEELPPDTEPGLSATYFFEPKNFTFPFGTHIAVVEVDRETGDIKFLRYVAVDDCGRVINPMLVDGQVHGGIVQSIGQAMFEEVVYDEQGQLVTGTLMDYALPRASHVPEFELDRTETPSPVNPPSGCRFHPRCPAADEVCVTTEPTMEPLGNGHFVACHHPLVTPVATPVAVAGH